MSVTLLESHTNIEFLTAQDLLIQEQSSKLASYGALSNSNHSVQFLSREAAEEERKELGMKLRKLEQTIREKDAAIADLNAKRKFRLHLVTSKR